jgi:ketosteroid isomerase-like protein
MKPLNLKFFCSVVVAGLLVMGCQTTTVKPGAPATSNAEKSIRALLTQQEREWNAGNMGGFMEVYARSEQTRFASGGDVTLGWQTIFDRYHKKYATRTAMGVLNFSDIEVTPLGSGNALVFGRWQLKREADTPSGLFTLIFRNTPDGWRIVHDHTSSAEKK